MIEIKNLIHSFNSLEIFNQFNIKFPRNKITSIIGPSGCGKSTLLNLIASLIVPEAGEIIIDFRSNKNIGYSFQSTVLLPWLTLKENILLPFKVNRINIGAQEAVKYNNLMKLMDLVEFENYLPREVSGGMKSKTILVRNLLYSPELILMDEAFANLDELSRISVQKIFFEVMKEYRSTVLFVTHSIDEAISVSDEIIVLSQKPAQILDKINIYSEIRKDVVERQKIKDNILSILAS